MVALPTNKNDETRSGKNTQDVSISGDGTIVEMCGIRWPRNWLAKKTGWKQERGKNTGGEAHIRHVRSWQNETIH